MNTDRNRYKVLVALVVLVIAGLACGGGGGDDDQVVVTATPINVGDAAATEIVNDTIEAIENTNKTMGVIAKINCVFGFDSCNETVENLDDVISPE